MKKYILAILITIISAISMYAYTVDANLKTDDGSQSLFLYGNGKCVVTTSSGQRGTGTYDINGRKIYINWDNGAEQQGSVRTVDGKVKTVYIEGVSYSRTLVVRRR